MKEKILAKLFYYGGFVCIAIALYGISTDNDDLALVFGLLSLIYVALRIGLNWNGFIRRFTGPVPTPNPTVYISPTGRVYHTRSRCNGLRCTKALSRNEAIEKGYLMCSRCGR